MSLVERNIRSRKRKMSKIKGVRIKFYKVFFFEKYDYYYWNMWLKINKYRVIIRKFLIYWVVYFVNLYYFFR